MSMRRLYSPSLWVKCLIASLGLHGVALYLWVKHPLLFTNSLGSLFHKTQPSPEPILQQEDLAALEDVVLESFLEEFFLNTDLKIDELNFISSSLVKQNPIQENTPALTEHPTSKNLPLLEESRLNSSLFLAFDPFSTSLSPEQLASNSLEKLESEYAPLIVQQKTDYPFPHIPTFQEQITGDKIIGNIPSLSSTASKEDFSWEQNLSLLSKQPTQKLRENRPTLQLKEKAPFGIPSQSSKLSLVESSSFSLPIESSIELPIAKLANIDDYLPSQTLYSLQWHDSFHIEPSFFPDEDGYVFFVTVTPKQSLEAQRIKQNIYILIDISSEIEKHKLAVFKKSAIKALSSLQSGDNFNIFLLDKTITAFSPYSCPFSLQNIRKAEQFLEKKQERNIFSSFDILEGLKETFSMIQTDEEVHTAILLTNGKFSNSFSSQQKAINHLLEKNNGKIHLFTAAVGKNNNIVNLDMLSTLCGGKLLYSDTNASFPRKLGAFIKTMQAPLAKDITLSIRPKDSKAELTLLSKKLQTPHLYSQEPFVISGKINRLCDLCITLEGKNEDGWVVINKEISFEAATEASGSLKKSWALNQAFPLYEKFLKDSKSIHLKEAKEILESAHGRVLGE